MKITKHYAAIGTDGLRPVVWGTGNSWDGAIADARHWLQHSRRESNLIVKTITAAQRELIEAGTVAVAEIGLDLDGFNLEILAGPA